MPLCPGVTFSLLSFQETLNKLLLKKPLRPHHHPLATYHYTGRPGQGGGGLRVPQDSSFSDTQLCTVLGQAEGGTLEVQPGETKNQKEETNSKVWGALGQKSSTGGIAFALHMAYPHLIFDITYGPCACQV